MIEIPNHLLDRLLDAQLSGTDFKVLLYVMQHTRTNGQHDKGVTLNMIMSDITPQGKPIAKTTALRALSRLEEEGLISGDRSLDENNRPKPTLYSFCSN